MVFTLNSERLTVREYTIDDLPAAHRIAAECFGSTDPVDATRTWLEWATRNYAALRVLYQPPYGDYAVVRKSDGLQVGAVGLVQSTIPWRVLEGDTSANADLIAPEFGLYWATLPEYQGHAYAGEAARAMIDFAFGTLRARRIVATTEHENHNSQRVMEKLGMTLHRNTTGKPHWCQVVGELRNPLWDGR
ncbi:MAG: GNAT family N-acetyltransferase [Anaerolineae bacterium]